MTRPHLSYSQLSNWRLCPARWYYDKVLGYRDEGSWATEYGREVHAQLETYLTSGNQPEDARARLATANLDHLPKPACVEFSVRLPIPDTDWDFVGQVDWQSGSRILDHKTKGSFDYVPSQHQLGRDVQLLLYAHAVQVLTGTEITHVGHHYIRSRGPLDSYIEWAPVSQGDISENWQTAVADFHAMIKDRDRAAGELERNLGACGAFAKPCPAIVPCDKDRLFSL